jgi:hypothetical protein
LEKRKSSIFPHSLGHKVELFLFQIVHLLGSTHFGINKEVYMYQVDQSFIRLRKWLLNPDTNHKERSKLVFQRLFILLPVLLLFAGVQSAMAQPDHHFSQAVSEVKNADAPVLKINFQPAKAVVPTGYLPDSGAAFGNRGYGLQYGWNVKVDQTRDQNVHSDQRYDTFNHMQKSGQNYTWELAVPKGSYELLLVMGDPKHANSTNSVNVEGTVINDPDGQDNFDEYTVTVTVNDGRLTIKPASGAQNAKIAFIHIMQAGTSPTPAPGPGTPPPGPGTPPPGQAVVSFTLINPATNQDIQSLASGDTLDLSKLPQSVSVRANTNPPTVGSVQFIVDGVNYRIENVSPYTLHGDNSPNSNLVLGQHTLAAIPYTQANGSGTAGKALAVTFNVIAGNGTTPTPEPGPGTPPPGPGTPPPGPGPPPPGPEPGEPPTLFGPEIGVDLDQINQLKADIAAGMYDRACTAQEHNPTQWHLLVNPVNKCHYDHHHGDDPNYVNDLFGQPGAWFGQPGQSISYPWQTFKAQYADEPNTSYVANRQMENDLKHEGYFWVVRRNQACPEPFCTVDFRLQVHAVFGAMDMPVRFHSYSFEARVCRDPNDPASCGIVRNGGWVDFGRLFTTDGAIDCGHGVNEQFINLPADTLYFPIDRPEARDEIRCHPLITNLPAYPSTRPLSEWWAHSPADRIRFQLRSFDPLGNVIPSDPAQWHLFCNLNDPNCRYDQSIMTAWIGYTLQISEFHNHGGPRLDANRDGRTDYRGYSNRWGLFVSNCTQPGLDCVPTEYSNVLLNQFPDDRGVFKEARYIHHICDDCPKLDLDLSPPNQKWITWFYRHAGMMRESVTTNIIEEPVDEAPETVEPTAEPTTEPVETIEPTAEPAETPEPTAEPTVEPTAEPTTEPVETIEPTAEPTVEPTVESTTEPAETSEDPDVSTTE